MPTHAYAVTGLFTVGLVITDDDGHVSTCATVASTMVSPVAAIDSLDVEIRGGDVLLTWRAPHAPDLLGFEVWRATTRELTTRIDRELVTDDDADSRFSFLDRNATPGGRSVYEIIAVGRGGEREPAGSLAVDVPALALGLLAPRPHPTPPPVDIAFDLPSAGHARARVVTAGGRLVAVVFDADATAGRHHITWNGQDVRGRPASAGVYLIVLEHGGESRHEKLVLSY
jgi:hypothetical protein